MHTLTAEARAWWGWTKRRWWVVYLALLAYSLVLQGVWQAEEAPRGERMIHSTRPGVIDRWSESQEVVWNVVAGPRVVTASAGIAYEFWPARADEEAFRKQAAPGREISQTVSAPNMDVLWAVSRSDSPMVILLHGSPGGAMDWKRVAPLLSGAGYGVIAVDLPGYGNSSRWLRGYSVDEQARGVVAFLRSVGISRLHLVGWSLGGGVALHMADQLARENDDRIASITLMSSIGVQESEGSGDYHFEHFKYAVGYGALVVVPELIPHFGLLGARCGRHAFVRNFWDTDQRPLRAVMERLSVPTLILHGRHDILVPARAAEVHHGLIPTSRLVMLDANHFLPFFQAEAASAHLVEHFRRHDTPGVAPRRDVLDLAPRPEARTWFERALARTEPVTEATAWPVEIAAIALAMLLSPTAAVVLCGVLVSHQQLDLFEAVVGLSGGWVLQMVGLYLLARVWGSRAYAIPILGARLPRVSVIDWGRRFERVPVRTGLAGQFIPARRPRGMWALGLVRPKGAALVIGARFCGVILWSLWSVTVYLVAARPVLGILFEQLGGLGAALGLILACLIVAGSQLLLTRSGRNELRARLSRVVRHEFWPAWLFYLPVLLYTLYLARRHKGFMLPSCCNPGIGAGGGLVGESKHAIMTALSDGLAPGAKEAALPTFLIPAAPSPQARAAEVEALLAERPDVLKYPVVLKPDQGQRGYAVRLMHSGADLLRYFETMRRPAILQPYHPGPCEAGVLWARAPGASRGRIFSITRKTFPSITGDGVRTLEELIESHPRYRCQARVYLGRFADRASEVIPAGETVRLAVSGNHCQGSLFSDGADLISPALEAAFDGLATNFGNPNGRGPLLDFGRFDVRYTSDDDLRAGRGFAVLELNGTLSESTNLYDPERSVLWAYGVLFRQWRTLYELGAHRRDTGRAPVRLGDFLVMLRDHFKHRDGPALAD